MFQILWFIYLRINRYTDTQVFTLTLTLKIKLFSFCIIFCILFLYFSFHLLPPSGGIGNEFVITGKSFPCPYPRRPVIPKTAVSNPFAIRDLIIFPAADPRSKDKGYSLRPWPWDMNPIPIGFPYDIPPPKRNPLDLLLHPRDLLLIRVNSMLWLAFNEFHIELFLLDIEEEEPATSWRRQEVTKSIRQKELLIFILKLKSVKRALSHDTHKQLTEKKKDEFCFNDSNQVYLIF